MCMALATSPPILITTSMTTKPLLLIGDADAIVGSVNPADANHERVVAISKQLTSLSAHVVFPVTAIAEAITAIHRRLASPSLTRELLAKVNRDDLPVMEVSRDAAKTATEFFSPDGSKENTYFDAIVAAIAKSNFADGIFSFDVWYKKLGFKLAEDLV